MLVDDNMIVATGRPFLFPPRTKEGDRGNAEAYGDVEDAGIAADEEGASFDDCRSFL